MECRRMSWFAQLPANAITHLSGGGDCVGEGDDLVRPRVALLHQAGNAVDQDRGLARAGSGHDQHRPVNVIDRFALSIVWSERSRMRL